MLEPDRSRRERDRAESSGPAVVEWEPAPLVRRFAALMVDWIGCLLISGIFADPRRQGWAPVLVLIVVYGIFLGIFGRTPGMFVARISCVSYTDGRPIGLPRAFLRGFLLALLIPALIMDSDRRGVHDRLAGSVVILTPPGR